MPFRTRSFAGGRIAGLIAVVVVAFTGFAAAAGAGEDPLSYHRGSDFIPSTPGVAGGAVGGFYNPGAWGTVDGGEIAFWWGSLDYRENSLDNWGIAHGGPIGFSMQTRTFALGDSTARVRDYQLGFGFGDRRNHFGLAWRWFGGERDLLDRESGLSLGYIARPNPHVSFGLSGFVENLTEAREGVADLGVRPLGRPWLTLFADYALSDGQRLEDGRWGVGAEVRPVQGLHVGVRLRESDFDDDARFHVNVGLTFDDIGGHAIPRFDEDGDRESTTYLLRFSPPFEGYPLGKRIRGLGDRDRIVPIRLEKKVLTYRRDRWFDETRVAWLDLARYLDRIEAEPSVAGVALHLSDFRGRPSLIWEFRERLARLRASGRTIHVYADRLDMSGYFLASVADEITLDPQGDLMLPGLALHRTYLRGLLDKLGLGVDEWRFLTHKTAFQSYSRSDMSEADREQFQRIVDVIYETWREGICSGRNLTPAQFDAIVNDDVLLTASMALDRGLVDGIGRWDGLVERLGKEEGLKVGALPDDSYGGMHPDELWGGPPRIAVVYAVGECAMDSGISGRSTSRHMRELARDPRVKAVVLRADSPGGDPLPSDLVTEAVRKLKDAGKPVVVSQGDVAASGGYWISMDGSRVLTTPLTLTGSIGVIAGWVWDDGFSGKTGLTADGVQRGTSADLFTGIRLPFLGVRVPERGVTPEEREHVKARILELYGDFVGRVAEGRGLEESRVREIAEGRVWMGGDAIDRGLCDAFGSLPDAVSEARGLAGLDPGEEVELVEYPPRRLFTPPRLLPDLPGFGLLGRWIFGDGKSEGAVPSREEGYEVRYLRSLADSPGAPLLLVPPESLPEAWSEAP